METMKEKGIQTSIHYPPIHLFSAYRRMHFPSSQSLAFTETMSARQVTLPLYPGLKDESIKLVVEIVREALSHVNKVSAFD